jgi:hypothetical protein
MVVIQDFVERESIALEDSQARDLFSIAVFCGFGLLVSLSVLLLDHAARTIRSRDQASLAEFRFSRASSWTFFIKVCNGLQQISHRSRSSSDRSCLSPLAPLMCT